MKSLQAQRWREAYLEMSRSEQISLGLSEYQFSEFCHQLALSGWPTSDTVRVEEMIPYTPPGPTVDIAWSLSGTHRFSVTFFRPDGNSDLHTTINYRHDATGEWHPDVLATILSINRGTPKSNPVQGLINALRVVHVNQIKIYPHGQTTSLDELAAVRSKKKKTYLDTPIHRFN